MRRDTPKSDPRRRARGRRWNLVLVGLRGSGKSTIGKMASGRLGLRFVDTDGLVEAQEGMAVREIFAERGEEFFRDAEARAIRSLKGSRDCIICAGGGAPCRGENRRILSGLGVVVWLCVSEKTVLERIRRSVRPALTALPLEDEVAFLMGERKDIYAAMADVAIVTDGKSPEESVHELEHVWRGLQDHDVRRVARRGGGRRP
jgi:shikimate kinase